MQIEEWLGKDNTLGIDIWKNKYQFNGESFDEWLKRVSGNDDKVADLIKNKKFLFGGRILANRGLAKNGYGVTYSNCLDGDTVIITDKGRFTLRELAGKTVNVLSCGKWREAQIKSFGKQPVRKLLVSSSEGYKEFIATSQHIWFAKTVDLPSIEYKEYTTDQLIPGMILQSDKLDGDQTNYPTWKVMAVSTEFDRREVFCAVVPDTQSFCIDGNILTHNCYVISAPEDNLESIFDCAKKLARTFSYGGGCGVDLSKLAPSGAVVRNAAHTTTGSVSFMDLYSLVTGLIGQNNRRK